MSNPGILGLKVRYMKLTNKIHFDDFVKRLPVIFADLASKPGVVFVEKEGTIYKLENGESWPDYDPEKVKFAINKTAGSWARLDTARAIENLYRAREEGTRPSTRP